MLIATKSVRQSRQNNWNKIKNKKSSRLNDKICIEIVRQNKWIITKNNTKRWKKRKSKR